MSEKPRKSAKNPTQINSSSACAGNSCWETQKPSKISSTPAAAPSHQAGRTSRDKIEVNRSRLPRKISSRPKMVASAQNALNGLAKDQHAPNRKRIPIRTSTAATEESRNRSTIRARTSHPTPVTRNIHHGPVSWSSIVSARPRGPAHACDWKRILISVSLRMPASTVSPEPGRPRRETARFSRSQSAYWTSGQVHPDPGAVGTVMPLPPDRGTVRDMGGIESPERARDAADARPPGPSGTWVGYLIFGMCPMVFIAFDAQAAYEHDWLRFAFMIVFTLAFAT